MKQLLFDDLYSWSRFSEERQIDFNGHLWVRPEGNVLIDPVPMSESDLTQFDELGGGGPDPYNQPRPRAGSRLLPRADEGADSGSCR